jgi:hypothetical protein
MHSITHGYGTGSLIFKMSTKPDRHYLGDMILCNVDESGRVLTMSYNRHVGAEDIRRCLDNVRDLMGALKPGFFLLTDLSNLESMEASCAPEIGAIMDLCSAKGMLRIVRVIPDPTKDIGFDLISHFHHHPPVRTQTHASLADAIKSLLAEDHLPDEAAEILPDGSIARKMEDDLAEAHFTLASRKEAEVNEGGLVEANMAG